MKSDLLNIFQKITRPLKINKAFSTTEKEMLAVAMTVENFQLYLYGRKFTIYTDHLPLTWIWTKKNPHPRIERWMMRTAFYEYMVIYKPGKDNHLADFLSRLNEEDPGIESNEEDDYHDQLVASIEFGNKSIKNIDEISTDEDQDDQIHINVIAREPTSETQNEYICYKIEQGKDEDIQWIKNLILENGDTRPHLTKFKNETQRLLHKEYGNLRVIEDLVYRGQRWIYEDTICPNRASYGPSNTTDLE